jgi:dienelactone hydrolase
VLNLRNNSKTESGEHNYRGSFMTCVNRDFKIERTIADLINKTKQGTGAIKIITVGSSLGGRCALYYGLKYDCDIIAGVPWYMRWAAATAG